MGSTDWVYTPSVDFNPGRVLTIQRLEIGGAVLPAQGHRRGWRAVEKSPEHRRNGAPDGLIGHAQVQREEGRVGNPFQGLVRLCDGRKTSLRGEGEGARWFVVAGPLRWPKRLGGGPAGFA